MKIRWIALGILFVLGMIGIMNQPKDCAKDACSGKERREWLERREANEHDKATGLGMRAHNWSMKAERGLDDFSADMRQGYRGAFHREPGH